ncbi:MAG TPA: hypothetical protein VNI01_04195 [Elusimicrobiota bacterium]|nr:hypothetical protein [Elusimicrobiota bacterium]
MDRRILIGARRWAIRISTPHRGFLRVLKERLPHYFRPARKDRPRADDIHFRFQRAQPETGTADGEDAPQSYPVENLGLSRSIRFKSGRISVRVEKKRGVEDACLYHPCFLGPLSLALREFGATLAHGALVSRGKEDGILLLGRSGSGKSTLSLAFLAKGFRYFSDEHPILFSRGGRVMGSDFISRIALPPASVRLFPELAGSLRWDGRRRKYLLDPDKAYPDRLGSACAVRTILFPRFSETASLSARRLTPLELFQTLMTDDYFSLSSRNAIERGLSRRYLDLMGRLANQARGYALRYGPRDVRSLPDFVGRLPRIA